jgi:mannose-6-phosphate isomerase-like protein (cupin superfamily)
MLVKRLSGCRGIIAGDGTRLFELVHPARDRAKVRYSLAVAQLGIGRSSLPHRLHQTEVYYILRGAGRMHVSGAAATVRAGDMVYIPPNAVQWLEHTGWMTIKFICVVDPAWTAESEHVLRDKPVARSQKTRLGSASGADRVGQKKRARKTGP